MCLFVCLFAFLGGGVFVAVVVFALFCFGRDCLDCVVYVSIVLIFYDASLYI